MYQTSLAFIKHVKVTNYRLAFDILGTYTLADFYDIRKPFANLILPVIDLL